MARPPAGGPWVCLGVPIDSVAAPPGGEPFGTEGGPAALRRRDLPARIGAADGGDLAVRVTGTARDPSSGIIGYPSVRDMVCRLRSAVAGVLAAGRRPVLMGGCCALVMGAVAGARDAVGRVGIVNVDGHVDAYDGLSSPTGEAADVPVGALLGHAGADLLALLGAGQVVQAGDAVVLGARDPIEAVDLADLPDRLGIVVLGADAVLADPSAAGRAAVDRFRAAGIGYWLHLDVDVLDEDVFAATDYLMPAGLDLGQLAEVLAPMGADPNLLGFSVGCYNPSKDLDGTCGDALADLLVTALAPTR
jgi:arginase